MNGPAHGKAETIRGQILQGAPDRLRIKPVGAAPPGLCADTDSPFDDDPWLVFVAGGTHDRRSSRHGCGLERAIDLAGTAEKLPVAI